MTNRIYKALVNSWVLLPAVPFYFMVLKWLQNIPIYDDFDMPLNWVMNFNKADMMCKLSMFVGQYGEHRLVPSKIIYLAYYYSTGTLNFRILGIIGTLQLLVVAFASIHFLRKYSAHWKFLSFIWILCIYDLDGYENAVYPMNAVGNLGQVAFFFLTLYMYDIKTKWLWLCIVVQVLCAYSNGNGVLAMLLIPFFCWLKGDRRGLIASSITGIVCITLNFTFHESSTLPTALPFDLNRSITYFIRMSGAHFNFDNSFWIGVLVLGLLVYVIPKKQKEWNSAGIICILGFVVGTMLLATYFRGNTSDAQFQTSRYLIYPQIMMACIIFFLFEKLKTKKQQYIGMAVTLLIMLPTYKHNYDFGELGFERTNARASYYKFWHPHPEEAEKISREADSLNIYHINDNR
jgi:hypothetical protein